MVKSRSLLVCLAAYCAAALVGAWAVGLTWNWLRRWKGSACSHGGLPSGFFPWITRKDET